MKSYPVQESWWAISVCSVCKQHDTVWEFSFYSHIVLTTKSIVHKIKIPLLPGNGARSIDLFLGRTLPSICFDLIILPPHIEVIQNDMITFWGPGVPGNDSSSQTCKPTNKINRSVPVRFIINNNWFYLGFSLSPVEQRGNVYLRPLKLPPLWISRPVTHTKCLSLLSDGFASHLLSFQPLRQSCHQGQRIRRSSGNFKSTWHILHLWVCVAMISPRIYPSSLCRASPGGPGHLRLTPAWTTSQSWPL